MATTIDPLLFGSAPRTYKPRTYAPASVPVRADRPRQSARVYQRRRRVLGASVVFALAWGVISTGAFASDPAASRPEVPRTVVARSGDTLWDIARQIVPQGSIADLVSELVRLNGSTIEPGQVIRIP